MTALVQEINDNFNKTPRKTYFLFRVVGLSEDGLGL